MLKNKIVKINLLFAILLSVAILAANRDVFWRPYIYNPHDALVSAHAHGFAMTNFAAGWKNPVMAKEIDLENGAIREYNHWPNGFFLVLAGAIKIFGSTEAVGRTVALLFTLSGLFFLAAAWRDRRGFVYLAIPLVLASRLGRDALPFVFLDAALFFFIALLSYAVSLAEKEKTRRPAKILFRAVAIISPFFCQLIAPFTAAGAVVLYFFHKNKKQLAADLAIAIFSVLAVLFFLSWTDQGLVSGAKELTAQFLHRSSIETRYEESVSFMSLGLAVLKRLAISLNILLLFLPFA